MVSTILFDGALPYSRPLRIPITNSNCRNFLAGQLLLPWEFSAGTRPTARPPQGAWTLPDRRKDLIVAVPPKMPTPNHRGDSSLRSLALPLPSTKVSSEEQRLSTNLGATPKSAHRFAAQLLTHSRAHLSSGCVDLLTKLCGKCHLRPSLLNTRATYTGVPVRSSGTQVLHSRTAKSLR